MVLPVSAAGTPTLSISSGEVKAGESVTLTVSIEDNPGIAAAMVYIYFDTDVFTVDPDKDLAAAGKFQSGGSMVANSVDEGTRDGVLALWFSAKNVSTDGEFVKINLRAAKDAPNGSYAVKLEYSPNDTCNENAENVQLHCKSGKIELTGGAGEKSEKDDADAPVSGSDRLSDSIVLRIGSYGAVSHGALKAIDEDNHSVTPIINNNDRTLVPIRFVAESLGAAVYWDADLRQITIEMAERTVVMTIGSSYYTVNGEQKVMDTAPAIVEAWGRTMVPIRFVAEALGMAVEWDAVNRLVLITPADRPWDQEGDAEADALSEVYQLMMLQSFL